MKKLISLLLALAMIAAIIPMSVSAAEKKTTTKEEPHKHKYNITQYDLKYHWKACSCGQRISMEPHVDPKDAVDDTCTCGLHFSDNADLVVLWVQNCEPIQDFNKNTTEYTLKTVSYKPVTEVKIVARPFDVQSTVELPEDLTLKEGTNTFVVKVTSGNQKVTKTYTLTVVNESK